jgi:hypothetical protein
VSLIEPFITEDKPDNIDKILRSVAPVQSVHKYDVDRVIGSSENNGKVLYLVKWEGWPSKKNWTRDPFDNFYSVGAQENYKNFTEIILMHRGTLASKPNNEDFLP